MAKKRSAKRTQGAKPALDMIAIAVNAAIEAKALTLYRVSAETGIDWDTLANWLKGKRSIRVVKAVKVLAFLELEVVPRKG